MVIGITGPIGSGKSYIGRLFRKKGLPVIDADKVYHSLTNKRSELTEELENEFGSGIINDDGSLNRAELSKIVFSDADKLSRLNEITHKNVIEMITRRVYLNYAKNNRIVVVEVPLMFESGYDKKCAEVISVIADEDVRVKRIMKRNGFSEEEAKKRIKNQKDNNFYIANSSKVLYNDTYKIARQNCERIYDEILTKYGFKIDN
jgi:dephospho-CoA kinase